MNLADAPLHIDARPMLPRADQAVWTHVDAERDRLYRGFNEACQAASIEAEVVKSAPFVYPAWVKFEVWLPTSVPATTERASVTITLEPLPHHYFEIQYSVTTEDRGRNKTVGPLRGTPQPTELVAYLLRRRRKPSFEPLRIRKFGFDLWRPKNKLVTVRRDLEGTFLQLLAYTIGFFGLAALLGSEESAGYLVAGVALTAAAGAILWGVSRRPVAVLSPGKPTSEPRSLRLADAWQTVLFDIGHEHEAIRQRVRAVLSNRPDPRFKFHEETVWYWGLDGKVERQQFVLSYRRGLVFCQVYQYGTGLYVGWDAHLNAGQWVEAKVGRGVDWRSGGLTQANTVMNGTQPLTEYDVTDLCCLTEWVHGSLVRLLKQVLAEKKIDQEIDFTIQRGERQRLTASEPARATKGLFGKPRRIA